LKLGKLASNFHSDTANANVNVGQPASLLCWWENGFFIRVLQLFFGDSLTRWPPFSSVPVLALLTFPLAVLVLIFLIFLQQDRKIRGKCCNEWGWGGGPFPGQIFQGGWLGGPTGCAGVTFVTVFSGVVNHKTRRLELGFWGSRVLGDDISLGVDVFPQAVRGTKIKPTPCTNNRNQKCPTGNQYRA